MASEVVAPGLVCSPVVLEVLADVQGKEHFRGLEAAGADFVPELSPAVFETVEAHSEYSFWCLRGHSVRYLICAILWGLHIGQLSAKANR